MSEAAFNHDLQHDHDAAAYGQDYEMQQHATPLVGHVLAARRQEVQWTVEQVAAQLKLAPRQVEAVEAGDYGALPGMAVARGFIRSYAKLMQIDVEPYMSTVTGSAVLNAMPPSRKPLAAVPFSEKQTGSLMGGGRHSSRLLLGGGVVLTLVVLGSALFAIQRAGWLTSAGESLASSGGKAVAMFSARPVGTVAEDAASARLDGMNMTLGEQGVLASAGAPIVPVAPAAVTGSPSASAGTPGMSGLTASPMLKMAPMTAQTAPTADAAAGAQGAAAAKIPAQVAAVPPSAPSASPAIPAPAGSAAPSTAAAKNPLAATGSPATTAGNAAKVAMPLLQPLSPGPSTDEATAQSPAASAGKLSSALDGARAGGTGTGGALSLVMHQDSWVEIRRADRSTIVSRMFRAGSAETFQIDGPVSLLVGNAHGVDVTLRGTPVELRAGNNNTARLNLK